MSPAASAEACMTAGRDQVSFCKAVHSQVCMCTQECVCMQHANAYTAFIDLFRPHRNNLYCMIQQSHPGQGPDLVCRSSPMFKTQCWTWQQSLQYDACTRSWTRKLCLTLNSRRMILQPPIAQHSTARSATYMPPLARPAKLKRSPNSPNQACLPYHRYSRPTWDCWQGLILLRALLNSLLWY